MRKLLELRIDSHVDVYLRVQTAQVATRTTTAGVSSTT